jgi:hypothetical protein
MIKYTVLPAENDSLSVNVQIDEGNFNGVVFSIHKLDFPDENTLESEKDPLVTIHFDVINIPESLGMSKNEVENNSDFIELVKQFVSDLIENFCALHNDVQDNA